MIYVVVFGSALLYFNLFKKKPWPRFWRWLLSIALGFVTFYALGFLLGLFGVMN